jgi:hypothetical protein
MDNKCSLDNMLQALLAAGNGEQNATYPPKIFDAQFNAVTSWLIDTIVELYPKDQQFVDILRPFLKREKIGVKNGEVALPKDIRNFLGASVSVRKDFTAECSDEPVTETQMKIHDRKTGCLSRPVKIVDQSEFDFLTTHRYKYPTYENPIGCWLDESSLKICPFDITGVEIRYIRNEKIYRYGYITQPDDTYIFDPDTTVESEWQNNAFKYLYRGLSALYGMYTRDNNFRNFAQELKQIGLT